MQEVRITADTAAEFCAQLVETLRLAMEMAGSPTVEKLETAEAAQRRPAAAQRPVD